MPGPDPVFGLLSGVPPAEILHFAVHGHTPARRRRWHLAGRRPPDQPDADPGVGPLRRAPFVFPQRLPGGQREELLGSYGGIAQAFLRCRRLAVVAPLGRSTTGSPSASPSSSITRLSPPAEATARAPERSPRRGRHPGRIRSAAVADILRRARQGLVQDAAAQSSTYIAYQFYGHPSLRLSWHGADATEDATVADLNPSGADSPGGPASGCAPPI